MHGVVLASSSPSLKRRLIKQSSLEGAYTVDLSTFDSEIAETVISYMYLGKLVSKEDWGPDKRLDLKLLMLVLGFTGDEMELFRTQTLRYYSPLNDPYISQLEPQYNASNKHQDP